MPDRERRGCGKVLSEPFLTCSMLRFLFEDFIIVY